MRLLISRQSARARAAPSRWGLALLLAAAGPAAAQNLAQNPGFESGTANWSAFGPVTFTTPTTQPHTGARSAFIQNRTDTWNGVAQSFLGILQNTNTYRISAWVRLGNSSSQTVLLTMRKTDGGVTSYTTVASGVASSNSWTQLSGGYTLSVSGPLTDLTLYLEGPAAGVTIYADDFDVAPDDWKSQANARIE